MSFRCRVYKKCILYLDTGSIKSFGNISFNYFWDYVHPFISFNLLNDINDFSTFFVLLKFSIVFIRREEVKNHVVRWKARYTFQSKMAASANTGMLESCQCRVSVRKVIRISGLSILTWFRSQRKLFKIDWVFLKKTQKDQNWLIYVLLWVYFWGMPVSSFRWKINE